MTLRLIFSYIILCSGALCAQAQDHRFYFGNGLDFMMLSTAIVSKPGIPATITAPRFTALVNFGFTINYDLNKNFGLSSGLGLRNMGFIEKTGETTIKRRVYSLGVPVGVKIGNLRNRNFTLLGGGVDLPFNYREKRFIKRDDKTTFNEWFSDRTPPLMPFVYIGQSFNPGITLKLQYYPMGFLNEDFETLDPADNVYKPYSGYKVNLLLLSLGIDIHYQQYKIQEREYQESKKSKVLTM